jgi:transcriptional regulator with XRE-family HTH domain
MSFLKRKQKNERRNKMLENKEIGKRIKETREKKRLTIIYVVDKLKERDIEISTDKYLEYENGDVDDMPIDTIGALGKVLDVNPPYLLGWLDENGEEIKD